MKATTRKRKPRTEIECVESIRKMKAQGITHKVIGERLRLSRSAISGTVYRYGIATLPRTQKDKRKDNRFVVAKDIAAKNKAWAEREGARKSLKEDGRYSEKKKFDRIMASAARGTCLWIEGEAIERNFCKKPIHQGTSWCQEHFERTYQCRQLLKRA